MLRSGFRAISKLLRLEPNKVFKGKDLYGNEYYEVPPQQYFFGAREVVKLKRTIEPPNMHEYKLGGLEAGENVPTEWMAWLQGRREDAPTAEEVEQNLLRIQAMREKVKMLKEKEQTIKEEPKIQPQPIKKDLEKADVDTWSP